MAWYKMDDAMHNDIKWPVVARLAKRKVGAVVSVWVALLGHASQSADRGSLAGFDCEMIDALFGYREGDCAAIVAAMEAKGLIADGRVAGWEKWQPNIGEAQSAMDAAMPEKPAQSGYERVKRHRQRQRALAAGADDNANDNDDNANDNGDNGQALSSGPNDNGDNAGDNAPRARVLKQESRIKNQDIKTPPIAPQGGMEPDASLDPQSPPEKPKRRRGPTGSSLPELRERMREWTQNPDLLFALEGFRAMRERMRRPLTGEALRLTLRELDKLAADDEGKIAILEQSIQRGWQGVFPPRGDGGGGQARGPREVVGFQELESERNKANFRRMVEERKRAKREAAA